MPLYDFDEAVNEDENEPVSIKVCGRVYELAPKLPARVVLKQIKLMDETGGIGTADLPEWLGSLVGEKKPRANVGRWCYMGTVRRCNHETFSSL